MADPATLYLVGSLAVLSCDQTANHNHIECDSNDGHEIALEGGYQLPMLDGFDLQLGVQGFHHWHKQHGWNEGRGKDDDQQHTADGETIRITGARLSATGILALWGPFSAYGGLAVGPAAFDTSRATKLVGVGQARGGLQIDWDAAFVRLGYQAWGTTKTSTGDGVPNRLTGHGPGIELGFRF